MFTNINVEKCIAALNAAKSFNEKLFAILDDLYSAAHTQNERFVRNLFLYKKDRWAS